MELLPDGERQSTLQWLDSEELPVSLESSVAATEQPSLAIEPLSTGRVASSKI